VTIKFCITKAGGLILKADGSGRATNFTPDIAKLNVKPEK
jgi:hypothetical protein